jgi:hypothetical protein
MTKRIKQPLALTATLAVLLSGCLLTIDGLEAGIDDGAETTGEEEPSDPSECLIGTEPDAVGVAQSIWDPQCEVVCDQGWGHGGPQVPITWTTSFAVPSANVGFQGHALGVLDDGRIAVALKLYEGATLRIFDPEGLPDQDYEVPNIGSGVYALRIAAGVLYVTHRMGDAMVLSAIEIASQQELWSWSFAAEYGFAAARGSATIALMFISEGQTDVRELVMLDLGGNPLWTRPVHNRALWVTFSPSGARVAVAGLADAEVYATANGALLDEIVHEPLVLSQTMAIAFVGEDRLISAGTVDLGPLPPRNGWVAGASLTGEGDWQQIYNRATVWCPETSEFGLTHEFFTAVTRLADGSLLAVGDESQQQQDGFRSQPRVVRFTPEGQFLAADRGLWDGAAINTIPGPDGSALVLFEDSSVPGVDRSYRLRKYSP